jgi:hypothetical protein
MTATPNKDTTMTPEQKLKHAILLKQYAWAKTQPAESITAENIDRLYDTAEDDGGNGWGLQDARSEVRCSGQRTGLKCEVSRHYESESVAAKMPDGSWVGWTYWFGGGKHGEPEAIDWVDEAYDLDCLEEEKVVTVRTFTKRESAA